MTETELLGILKSRFEANMNRHQNIYWPDMLKRLQLYPEKLRSLETMERTGGEPDVLELDGATGEYIFYDCSPESPIGRRNVCYDGIGQQERIEKGVFPKGNAIDMAASMGIELLTQEQYKQLQKQGNFDTKTSSWLMTPEDIRKLGGAIFGDRRYGHVFVYHNGAPSFYSSRGFRGRLRV
ncbi:DUF4256 domain-containing protein [Oscillospiraceae bacterium CM]|nr:DUF4256 domain-containing protein [Oscillospiraceae bacterium CM]